MHTIHRSHPDEHNCCFLASNILLNETHAPAVPLRFDGLIWRYVGYWILMILIIFLFVLVGGSLIGIIMTLSGGLPAVASTGETGATILIFLFMIPFSLWLLVVFFRFSLVLPAAAIGRRGFGLRMAWNLTRGNSWQILKINLPIVVFGFVVGLVLFFISLSVGYMSGGVPIWLFLLANTFVNYIFVLLGIGVLSLSYAYLTQEQPPEDASIVS